MEVGAFIVRLKLAFCITCAVYVLVLAQGPSFVRLKRAWLRWRGGLQEEEKSDSHLGKRGITEEVFHFY